MCTLTRARVHSPLPSLFRWFTAYEVTSPVVNGLLNATGPRHITIGDAGNREGLCEYAKSSRSKCVFTCAKFMGIDICNALTCRYALVCTLHNQEGL